MLALSRGSRRTPNDGEVSALQKNIKAFRPAHVGPRNVYPIRKILLKRPKNLLWMERLRTHGFNCIAQRAGCFSSATAREASRCPILR